MNAIVRQSDISMPDMSALSLHKKTGSVTATQPMTAEAESQLNNLMGDLDGLLDGTND